VIYITNWPVDCPQLDDDYKAATKKMPEQKANDLWAAIRPTPTAPAPKKKQQ